MNKNELKFSYNGNHAFDTLTLEDIKSERANKFTEPAKVEKIHIQASFLATPIQDKETAEAEFARVNSELSANFDFKVVKSSIKEAGSIFKYERVKFNNLSIEDEMRFIEEFMTRMSDFFDLRVGIDRDGIIDEIFCISSKVSLVGGGKNEEVVWTRKDEN